MRRKILQDHANVFCQMLVGWRMLEDLGRLRGLGSGNLALNVLTSAVTFEGSPIEPLFIAKEISTWFAARLEKYEIPREEIHVAIVEAEITLEEVKRGRRSATILDWNCRSLIRTIEKEYIGHLAERHTWVHAG